MAPALFSDWPSRTGLKFALAGIIALIVALAMRLDEPTWAVVTAFVLSTPKFVGAIAEKTVFRIVGALFGAVIGYLITGSLEQSPIIFLGLIGILVAFTTAMYGGTFAPYLLRQTGYTATIVASQGMASPDLSWRIGMARCEEICVGILVTGAVTLLIWPRHAYREFDAGVRSVLRELAVELESRAAAFFGDASSAQAREDAFSRTGEKLAALRKLIRVGNFESRSFASITDCVQGIVGQLGALVACVYEIQKALPADSEFFPYLREPAVRMRAALLSLMQRIADPAAGVRAREEAFQAARREMARYEEALEKFRMDGGGERLAVRESLNHAGYSLAMRGIYAALAELHRMLPSLEAAKSDGFPRLSLRAPTLPSREWVMCGIRGGLAVVTAFVLVNWGKLPGGSEIIVGTYLFTAFTLDSSDLRGDLGIFNWLGQTALICLALFFFLLVAAPLMSNFLVFVLVLGTLLFVTGHRCTTGKWNLLQTLVALLIVVSLVDLNPQRPVAFPAIVDSSLGLLLAAVLSAFFCRILWPVLPQNHLREQLDVLLSNFRGLCGRAPRDIPAKARAEFVLAAAHAGALIRTLRDQIVVPEHAERLLAYVRELSRAGSQKLIACGAGGADFPGAAQIAGWVDKMESECALAAEDQRASISGDNRVDRPLDVPDGSLDFYPVAEKAREIIRAARLPIPKSMDALGSLYLSLEMAEACAKAGEEFRHIDFREVLTARKL